MIRSYYMTHSMRKQKVGIRSRDIPVKVVGERAVIAPVQVHISVSPFPFMSKDAVTVSPGRAISGVENIFEYILRGAGIAIDCDPSVPPDNVIPLRQRSSRVYA